MMVAIGGVDVTPNSKFTGHWFGAHCVTRKYWTVSYWTAVLCGVVYDCAPYDDVAWCGVYRSW